MRLWPLTDPIDAVRYRVEGLRARLIGLIIPGVSVDSATRIGAHVRIRCGRGASIDLRGSRVQAYGLLDAASGARIQAAGVSVGRFSVIAARAEVIIGPGTRMADWVTVRDHEHKYDPDLGMSPTTWIVDRVVLEERVWMGSKATVTAGVHLGAMCAVGANAVVTKSAPPGTVLGGVPARPLRGTGGSQLAPRPTS